ncbi:MAG: cation diffusion facilitator family transporter [Carbonactinosporaceae bacterium]
MGAGHGHGVPGSDVRSAGATYRRRLIAVLAITSVVLVAQIAGGLYTGSLALLADAGHLFTDVAGIGLSLLALHFGSRPATPERTYGYFRLEILAAVANAVLLFGVTVVVSVEAVRRFAAPPDVAGGPMLAIALLGLVANGAALLLLRKGQRHSLNLRGAYLEVLGDLLGSLAVIGAAVTIALTGFGLADPVASLLIALMILPRTYGLLREAVDVLLEAVPKGVDLAEVRQHIVGTPGVLDVHDLHAWTITSGLPVLSAHVVVDGPTLHDGRSGQLLDALHACLAGHFDVEHSTFQIEPAGHVDHEGARHA